MIKVRLLVIILDLLAKHPLFVKIFLRPIANARSAVVIKRGKPGFQQAAC